MRNKEEVRWFLLQLENSQSELYVFIDPLLSLTLILLPDTRSRMSFINSNPTGPISSGRSFSSVTPLGTRKSYKPRREWKVLDSVGRREAQINELKAPAERLLMDTERIQKEKDDVERKIKEELEKEKEMRCQHSKLYPHRPNCSHRRRCTKDRHYARRPGGNNKFCCFRRWQSF